MVNINRTDYSSNSVNQGQELSSLQKLKESYARMPNLTDSAKVFHKTIPDLNIRSMKYADPVHTKQDSIINRNTSMKYKESTITEHESTIKLNNNISRIKYSSSNTREKSRNVKSNSDLNKYLNTVNGNNVFTSEICESHRKNRDIPRSDATRHRSTLGRDDSDRLGSGTRTRQTLTRLTRARSR